eukprot:m.453066 g.453066  ORF g.453066 m.453066 type:complete len:52 (-) comp20430_c0_seq1:68-223(-)
MWHPVTSVDSPALPDAAALQLLLGFEVHTVRLCLFTRRKWLACEAHRAVLR